MPAHLIGWFTIEHLWLLVGFAGQALFASRFILQWFKSEMEGRSVIPIGFWYCSVGGGIVMLVLRQGTALAAIGIVFGLAGAVAASGMLRTLLFGISRADLISYLAAGALVVPITQRLGLGSVLGFLIAGMAIGPWGLGLIDEPKAILHFAEFGIVLLLFLVTMNGLAVFLRKKFERRW